ncbi:hypothetical protein BDD12DRAFT_801106 [Trichophaea hybrida]|nr:hypothetical protein BDD12DRAFT_801106 [Trichophaea hybrida]
MRVRIKRVAARVMSWKLSKTWLRLSTGRRTSRDIGINNESGKHTIVAGVSTIPYSSLISPAIPCERGEKVWTREQPKLAVDKYSSDEGFKTSVAKQKRCEDVAKRVWVEGSRGSALPAQRKKKRPRLAAGVDACKSGGKESKSLAQVNSSARAFSGALGRGASEGFRRVETNPLAIGQLQLLASIQRWIPTLEPTPAHSGRSIASSDSDSKASSLSTAP